MDTMFPDMLAFTKTLAADIPGNAFGAACVTALVQAHPFRRVGGIRTELMFGHLPCLRKATWVNSACIMSFCERLSQMTRETCAAVTSPTVEGKDFVLLDNTKRAVRCLSSPLIFMPICIGQYHWTALVIDKILKTIYVYDPQGRPSNGLKNMAHLLQCDVFYGFQVEEANSQVQKDGHSCGPLVCWYFYMKLGLDPWYDFSTRGMIKWRLKILYTLLQIDVHV